MSVVQSTYKYNVARSFNRAVATYDAQADLQFEVGHKLLDRIKSVSSSVTNFLDIGAGTGLFNQRILNQYQQANCYFVDIAEEMLSKCQSQLDLSRSVSICADFDCLPFAAEQFDFVFSSMCLQWSLDLAATLEELLRVTTPGGLVALAFLTEGTLSELSDSFSAVNHAQTVNQFYPQVGIKKILAKLPVSLNDFHTDNHSKVFANFAALMKFLKNTGANFSKNRKLSLTLPSHWRQLESYYKDNYAQQGGVKASFNVSYIVMRKK